jgi:CBS domain-containing protein
MSNGNAVADARLVAGDVMRTDVFTVRADATVNEAWRLIFASGCTHLIVTDHGHVAGVIDDRTIALEWPGGAFESRRRLVSSLIHGISATVFARTDVQDVALLMSAEGVTAVAVVTETGAPLGLITAADLVAVLARAELVAPVRMRSSG